jgi:hypothetical protein
MNRTSNHLASALSMHNRSGSERILPFLLTMILLAAPVMCLAQVPVPVTTFTNPSATLPFFGYQVEMVGGDKVLVSSFPGDIADGMGYLYGTNGTLLTTFTNPIQSIPPRNDAFGYPVAALGTDRVLIRAYRKSAGASAAGTAFLFDLNGAVLTAYTNPAPMAVANFGSAVATVGSDRVLIGAPREGGAGVTNTGGGITPARLSSPPCLSQLPLNWLQARRPRQSSSAKNKATKAAKQAPARSIGFNLARRDIQRITNHKKTRPVDKPKLTTKIKRHAAIQSESLRGPPGEKTANNSNTKEMTERSTNQATE